MGCSCWGLYRHLVNLIAMVHMPIPFYLFKSNIPSAWLPFHPLLPSTKLSSSSSSSSSSYLFLTQLFSFDAAPSCWGLAECWAPCEVLKGSRKPGRGSSCNAEPCLLLSPSLPLHTPSSAPYSVNTPPVGSHPADLLEVKPRALNEAMVLTQEASVIDRQPGKVQGEEQGRAEIGSGRGASSHPGVKMTSQDLAFGEAEPYNCASTRKDALKRVGRRWAGLGATEQAALGTRRESVARPGKGKLAGQDEVSDEI